MEAKDIAAVVISIAALLISLYGIHQKRSETRRALRLQLTHLVDELNAVNYYEEQTRSQAEREGWTYGSQSSANARRALLASQAAALANDLRKDVTAVELQTIAHSLTLIGEREQAAEVYGLALSSAATLPPLFRVVVKRSYATYLFGSGGRAEARRLLRSTVDVDMRGATHDAGYGTTAETLCRWIELEVRYTARDRVTSDEVRMIARLLTEARGAFGRIEDQEAR